MKFILHLGSAKTGSTSLQTSLDMARSKLARKGVWYPLVERRVPRRHNILATPFQRNVQRVYAGKKIKGMQPVDYALAQWEQIAKSAHKYETVVVSSEHLGAIDHVEKFSEFFRSKFPDAEAEAIYYMRKPSKHAASRMQQRIAANHLLTNFRPINYYSVVKTWKEYFPVQLREFSPTALKGGGIASDFAQTISLDVELTEVRKNESLSAEAMQILQDYRMQYYSDIPNKFTPDTLDLKVLLKDLPNEQNKKAVLQDRVADTLDRMEFVHKLKDAFGFEFEDLDYSKGIVTPAEIDEVFKGTEVRDYMEFDETRFRELQMEVLHTLFNGKRR